VLNSTNCGLENIPNNNRAEVFVTFYAHTIDFSKNKAKIIENYTFINYPYLTHLNVSDNVVTSLEFYAFAGLKRLKTLNFEGNRLTVIDWSLFRTNTGLESLNLANNLLVRIDNSQHQTLPSLSYLNLAHNNLTTLDDKIWKSNLREAVLLTNRWNCLFLKILKNATDLPSNVTLLVDYESYQCKNDTMSTTKLRLELANFQNTKFMLIIKTGSLVLVVVAMGFVIFTMTKNWCRITTRNQGVREEILVKTSSGVVINYR
jgi:Leucine rich repeat